MMRLLLLLIAVVLVAAVAAWTVAYMPGTLTLVWFGYEISMPAILAAAALVVAVLLLTMVLLVVRGVLNLPSRWRAKRADARLLKRATLLEEFIMAHASGQHEKLPVLVSRYGQLPITERRASITPLLQLISYCANQQWPLAEQAMLTLLQKPELRDTALRIASQGEMGGTHTQHLGYSIAHLAQEDIRDDSLVLALHAIKKAHNWQAGLEMISASERRHSGVSRMWHGALARQLEEEKAFFLAAYLTVQSAPVTQQVQQEIMAAMAQRQSWLPLSLLALTHCTQPQHKATLVEYARGLWRDIPHPQLAAFIVQGSGASEQKRLGLAQWLLKYHPQDGVAQQLAIQAAIDAGRWVLAAEYLEKYRAVEHEARWNLITQLRKSPIPEKVRGKIDFADLEHMARHAEKHTVSTQWSCRQCNAAYEGWQPVCTQCNTVDSVRWLAHGISPHALLAA